MLKEEKKIEARLLERGGFKYAFPLGGCPIRCSVRLVGGGNRQCDGSPMGSFETLCARSGRGQLAVASQVPGLPLRQELSRAPCLHGVGPYFLFIPLEKGLASP